MAVKNVLQIIVIIAKDQQIAQVLAANQVPNMKKPQWIGHFLKIHKKDPEWITKLWEQLDITGSNSWTENQKTEIKQFFEDYSDVFALNPLELGRTSLVKHAIKVIDLKPFKERYHQILPHQFEEVCKHLKEMEAVGLIHRSSLG